MSKYWNYGRAKAVALRNSPEPFHKVTHREIGDIPGCTPAPRSGIHRSETLEEFHRTYEARITRFTTANSLNMMDKQQYFRGHSLIEPMFGAYGEKL